MLGINVVIDVPNREKKVWPLHPYTAQSLDMSCLWEGEYSWGRQFSLVEGGKLPGGSAGSHWKPTFWAAGNSFFRILVDHLF